MTYRKITCQSQDTDYFKGWENVIDRNELSKVISILNVLYKTKEIFPCKDLVFKAFQECPYSTCKVVIIGQDPYYTPNVATGIAFANNNKVSSPSLEIIKNAVVNLEIPHNSYTFDPTLRQWARQGVLLLNSALTVERNKALSHTLLWHNFMIKLLTNLSKVNAIGVYILLGKTAWDLERYIKNSYILKDNHPSYYARTNTNMSDRVFRKASDIVYKLYEEKITWFNKLKF